MNIGVPDSEKDTPVPSIEGDGQGGLLSKGLFIRRATYERYRNFEPNEIYNCMLNDKIWYLLIRYLQLQVTACKFCNRVQFSPRYELTKMSMRSQILFLVDAL